MKNISSIRSVRFLLVLFIALFLAMQSATAQNVAAVSGKVTNSLGNALANSTVEVLDPASGATVVSSSTDDQGRYQLSVATGTYDIRVIPPVGSGFQQAIAPGRLINADTTIDFVLVPSGAALLSGRVLDGEGAPVPDVRVELYPASGDSFQVITDSSGQYSFRVAAGNYTLSAWAYPVSGRSSRFHW